MRKYNLYNNQYQWINPVSKTAQRNNIKQRGLIKETYSLCLEDYKYKTTDT